MAQNSIFPDLQPFHSGLSREQESEATTAIRLWCESACEDLGDELAEKVNREAGQREWSAETYIQEATRLAIEGGWV